MVSLNARDFVGNILGYEPGGWRSTRSSDGEDLVVEGDGDKGDMGAGVVFADDPECSTSSSRRRASSLATLARNISVRLTCFLS